MCFVSEQEPHRLSGNVIGVQAMIIMEGSHIKVVMIRMGLICITNENDFIQYTRKHMYNGVSEKMDSVILANIIVS